MSASQSIHLNQSKLRQNFKQVLKVKNTPNRLKKEDEDRIAVIDSSTQYPSFDSIIQKYPEYFHEKSSKFELFKYYFLVLKFLKENPTFPAELREYLMDFPKLRESKEHSSQNRQHDLQTLKRIVLINDPVPVSFITREIFQNLRLIWKPRDQFVSDLTSNGLPRSAFDNNLRLTDLLGILSTIIQKIRHGNYDTQFELDSEEKRNDLINKISTVFPGLKSLLDSSSISSMMEDRLARYLFMAYYADQIKNKIEGVVVRPKDHFFTGQVDPVTPGTGAASARQQHTAFHQQQIVSFLGGRHPCDIIYPSDLDTLLGNSTNVLSKIFR